nr:MAG TPA: hypothetical protein [Bacteriophage sp.]
MWLYLHTQFFRYVKTKCFFCFALNTGIIVFKYLL